MTSPDPAKERRPGRTAEQFRPGEPAAGSDYADPAGVGADPAVEDAAADEDDRPTP